MKEFITSHLEEAVTEGRGARAAAMAADPRKTCEKYRMTDFVLGSEAMYFGRGMRTCAMRQGQRERSVTEPATGWA